MLKNQPQLNDIYATKIAIIGIPGSGKSTLTKTLSEELDIPAFYEPWETNPFISTKRTAPPELVTLLQVIQLHEQHLAYEGIFECLPMLPCWLFLSDSEKDNVFTTLKYCKIKFVSPTHYTKIIALNPDIETVRQRIQNRYCKVTLEEELRTTLVRYRRFQEFLKVLSFLNNLVVIEGDRSVDKIVKEVLS